VRLKSRRTRYVVCAPCRCRIKPLPSARAETRIKSGISSLCSDPHNVGGGAHSYGRDVKHVVPTALEEARLRTMSPILATLDFEFVINGFLDARSMALTRDIGGAALLWYTLVIIEATRTVNATR
jgi:hypothetical protein